MPPASSVSHLPSGQPAARQRPKSPNRVLAETERQWIYSEEELAHSPSIQDGMSPEKEKETRSKGINFIRQVGIMLKLPELTLSTAAIFFNRYLMRNSLVDKPGRPKSLHHYTLGATCLFLATKVEESCRKTKDLIIACIKVAQKKPNLVVDEQSRDFWRWRDTILLSEDLLLESLCFDLTIEAPHKQLFEMLKYYNVEHNKRLRNAAWGFVTDSNLTQLCLISTSRTIAAAALYAGARICEVQLPDRNGRPWWEAQHVRLKEMLKTTEHMAANYEHKAEGGQSIYVGLRAEVQEGEEPPWERTRLKTEQDATTPVHIGLDLRVRGTSVDSAGSKRKADELNGGREDGEKRRRVDEIEGQASVNTIKEEPAAANPVKEDEGNGSEEGEVEE